MLKPFDSPQYRKRCAGATSGDECCICGRQTAGLNGAIFVPVDHTVGEFVNEVRAVAGDERISLYPIGPECVKKWRKEFDAERLRLRRTRGAIGDVVAYGHTKT